MEFSLLLEARFERSAEGVKSHIALGLQNLIGQFLLLLLEVGGIGLFFFRNAIDKPVCADVQRGANVAGLELKGGGDLLAADCTGDGAAASEEIAGFRFEAERFGCGIEFLAGFDTLGEIFGFRAGQECGLLQIQPAHPGSLEEVRDKIVTELKQQKSALLARTKAEDLAKRVKAGEKFDSAAKSLGLEAKTSDLLARNGSISGAVNGKQIGAAFQLKTGDVGSPLNVGANWFVYRVAEKEEPNPADFEKQKKELTDQVLQTKRNMAFDAFRTSLEARLKQEGKLHIMSDKMKGFGDLS